MEVTGVRVALVALSALAVITLQGYFAFDGGLDAMKRHAREGRFSNGKALHHVYLGLPVIDDMLSWSVAYWDPVCHLDQSARLLSITLSASVQSLGVFTMIESLRRRDKNLFLRWFPINIFAWQYIGAAIFIPIYFLVEYESHFRSQKAGRDDPSIPLGHAKSMLPATALTIIHLYRMVYFPPTNTTSSQHQAWLAVWQLAPFFCYCALTALASHLSSDGEEKGTNQATGVDAPWIKATYLVFSLLSAIVHVGVLWILINSTDESVSLAEAFVPRHSKLWQTPAVAEAHNYVEQSAFFLQWDYIIIVLASAVYVTAIVGASPVKQQGYWIALTGTGWFCVSTIASLILSPGFVYGMILYKREDVLRHMHTHRDRKPKT